MKKFFLWYRNSITQCTLTQNSHQPLQKKQGSYSLGEKSESLKSLSEKKAWRTHQCFCRLCENVIRDIARDLFIWKYYEKTLLRLRQHLFFNFICWHLLDLLNVFCDFFFFLATISQCAFSFCRMVSSAGCTTSILKAEESL